MYQIAILRHMYNPDLQGDETPRIHSDEYETIKEAMSVIDEWDNDVYVTSHNESGRPTYLIVEASDGDYIQGGRNQDMSNYDWDDADCVCGECRYCTRMMIEQDRQYLTNKAVAKL